MYVCVGVRPHVCLLMGRVVARAAVQREGGALPLAMLGHVTLEKGLAVGLEPAHVTPGPGWKGVFPFTPTDWFNSSTNQASLSISGESDCIGNKQFIELCWNEQFMLPVEVGATCGRILAEAGVGFCEERRREMLKCCKEPHKIHRPQRFTIHPPKMSPSGSYYLKLFCDWGRFCPSGSTASLLHTQRPICMMHKSMAKQKHRTET